MFQITELSLYNFKGFEKKTFSFAKPRTILGGPNGYGKTTIFDALELLFTGKIARMEVYVPGHDGRSSLSDAFKPLVFDTSLQEITVEARVRLSDKKELCLRRRAEQSHMRNPVDFSAFSGLQYFDGTEYKDVSTIPELKAMTDKLAKHYGFLHYMTQEEANEMLKCKESERKKRINALFNTADFDTPLKRLDEVKGELNSLQQNISGDIKQLESDIDSLQSVPKREENVEDATSYVRLFQTDVDWDAEDPKLSFEGFNSLLAEGGVLDNLAYYCHNAELFHWFEDNRKLNAILESDGLKNFVFWLIWRGSVQHINQFGTYLKGLKRAYETLSISTITSFALDLPDGIDESLVSPDSILSLLIDLNNLKERVKSTNTIQRAYSDLLTSRASTVKTLSAGQPELHLNNCPMCGNEFDSEDALMRQVSFFGQTLNNELHRLSQGLSTAIETFKQSVSEVVILPIDEYFQSLGIDKEVLTHYQSIDQKQMAESLKFLVAKGLLAEEDETVTDDMESILEARINNWQTANAKELPADFDTSCLYRIYTSFVRNMIPDALSLENIEAKRKYLVRAWNTSASALLRDKTEKLNQLKKQENKLNTRLRLVKLTIDRIKQRKNDYLSKMVSQIETLFYIYTGRIMQDNYYGRGCFLHYNQSNSNVLFTSGNSNDEVDAIYKMSSGQLVSISVAFLLTVNKLYAEQPFLAIDDPVQTIDDLNLWGLMETLRHDFEDRCVLLSTHERDFGLLLADKFRKVGLPTEFFDMDMSVKR